MSSQTASGSGVRAKKARSQGTDKTVAKAMAIAAISRWRRGLSGRARIVSTQCHGEQDDSGSGTGLFQANPHVRNRDRIDSKRTHGHQHAGGYGEAQRALDKTCSHPVYAWFQRQKNAGMPIVSAPTSVRCRGNN